MSIVENSISDQISIAERLNKIEYRLSSIESLCESLQKYTDSNNKFINRQRVEAEYREKISNSIAKWIRILIVILPIFFGFGLYLAYETGLYTPTPVKSR